MAVFANTRGAIQRSAPVGDNPINRLGVQMTAGLNELPMARILSSFASLAVSKSERVETLRHCSQGKRQGGVDLRR